MNTKGKMRCFAGSMAVLMGLQGAFPYTNDVIVKAQQKIYGIDTVLESEKTVSVTTSSSSAIGSVVTTNSGIVETPNPAQQDKVSFRKASYSIPLGWTKKVSCTVPASMKDYTLVYSSADKKIATVTKNGTVKGVSIGSTKITVKAKENPSIKASYIAVVEKEKKGWHTTAAGKKYYVNEKNERTIGYFKANGNYYYAAESSYILTNKWKYVEIDKKNYKLYFGSNGKQKQDVTRLLGEQKEYKIEVNISQNTVIVYAKDGKKGYTIPVKAMVCSCGIKGHATITGNYSKLRKAGKWHPLYYGTYGKYCTRISGPYLFHSVVYKKNKDDYSLNANEFLKLGKAASHGCIRLQVKDAKWIYNRSGKCSVTLYKGKGQLPLMKPKILKPVIVDENKVYDPTDVDVKK